MPRRRLVDRQIRVCALGLVTALCSATAARAQICVSLHSDSQQVTAATPNDLPDRFAQEVRQLAREQLSGGFAGGAVAYVNEGVIVACGLGDADASRKVAVDPQRTRFYVGSITKTFTGLAIAQLIRAGTIHSVDDPANRYLKRFRVPDAHGRAITIRELLTHTAGFEDRAADVGTDRVVPTPLTAKQISELEPALAFEPGIATAYSNFGTALLGLLIEDVTGQNVEDYFRAKIWHPLGMVSTEFARGLNAPPDAVKAQRLVAGHPRPEPYLAFNPLYWPVGAIVATPLDMGRYVRAHVLGAGPDGDPDLDGGVFALAHERLFANNPAVMGFGMLMVVGDSGGQTVCWHGGAWPFYDSMLFAIPGRREGFFVSIAALEGSTAPSQIIEITNRLAAALIGPSTGADPAVPPTDLDAFSGRYFTLKRNVTGFEKFVQYLAPDAGVTEVSVARSANGLLIDGRGPYRPVGRDMFVDPRYRYAPTNPFHGAAYGFMRDAAGRVFATSSNFGLWASERISAFADPRIHRTLALGCLPILLLSLGMPLWLKRDTGARLPIAACVLQPLLLAGMGGCLFAAYGPDSGGLQYYLIRGHEMRFVTADLMGSCFVLATFIQVIDLAALLLGRRSAPVRGRAIWLCHRSAVALASLCISAFLVEIHLALFIPV